MNRIFFFLIVLLGFSFSATAQISIPSDSTVADSLKVESGKIIGTLTNVIGWGKNDHDKWVKSLNKIPFYESDYNNPYYEKYLLGTENFNQIQLMEMKVDDKPYLAMIIQYTKGYYKNQKEQSDWTYFKSADYFLLDRDAFKNLLPDTIPFNKHYGVNMRIYYTGTVPASNMSTVPEKIAKDINKNIRLAALYDTTVKPFFQFSLFPIHDKRGRYLRFNTSLGYAKTGSTPGPPPTGNFVYQYYELTYDKFKAFARLK